MNKESIVYVPNYPTPKRIPSEFTKPEQRTCKKSLAKPPGDN